MFQRLLALHCCYDDSSSCEGTSFQRSKQVPDSPKAKCCHQDSAFLERIHRVFGLLIHPYRRHCMSECSETNDSNKKLQENASNQQESCIESHSKIQ